MALIRVNINNIYVVIIAAHKTMPGLCKEKLKIGRCKALMPRFFYNVKSGRCEKFNYGGCGGNRNRFDTLKMCQSTCPSGKRILATVHFC